MLGQLWLEAVTDCVTQYFKPLEVESDQLQLRGFVQYNISVQHPLNCSDELKRQPKIPPPEPQTMIYGKEAKTIIAFLLLLFFQG